MLPLSLQQASAISSAFRSLPSIWQARWVQFFTQAQLRQTRLLNAPPRPSSSPFLFFSSSLRPQARWPNSVFLLPNLPPKSARNRPRANQEQEQGKHQEQEQPQKSQFAATRIINFTLQLIGRLQAPAQPARVCAEVSPQAATETDRGRLATMGAKKTTSSPKSSGREP